MYEIIKVTDTETGKDSFALFNVESKHFIYPKYKDKEHLLEIQARVNKYWIEEMQRE